MVEHQLLAKRVFKKGGDMHPHTAQKQIGFPNQKGKPPKLLQQSGGTPERKILFSEFQKEHGGTLCRFSVNDSIK